MDKETKVISVKTMPGKKMRDLNRVAVKDGFQSKRINKSNIIKYIPRINNAV